MYIPAACPEKEPVLILSLMLTDNFLVGVIVLNIKKDTSKSGKRVTKTKYR